MEHPKPSGHPAFRQRRYYDFNVGAPEKRVEKLKYIHRNPVHRGLVEKPEDWPWSSYRHYATGEAGTVQIESPVAAWKRRQPCLGMILHPVRPPPARQHSSALQKSPLAPYFRGLYITGGRPCGYTFSTSSKLPSCGA